MAARVRHWHRQRVFVDVFLMQMLICGRWVLPEYCSREGCRVEVRIPRHAKAGMVRALGSQSFIVFSLFEVPILAPRMRRLFSDSTFLVFFKVSLFLEKTISTRDKHAHWGHLGALCLRILLLLRILLQAASGGHMSPHPLIFENIIASGIWGSYVSSSSCC